MPFASASSVVNAAASVGTASVAGCAAAWSAASRGTAAHGAFYGGGATAVTSSMAAPTAANF